ncbi:MAG: 50S ribosomal protein L6 [Magnetococcales bacterium]|nr:50S ribosomal protein L6 [Magnetococcales bacterium]
MSRIGKLPISVPKGVEVIIENQTIQVTGKLGSLTRKFPDQMQITQDGDLLTVTPQSDSKDSGALWGLSRALLNNMVKGVSDGFTKSLEIIGVGYRAAVEGRILRLNLGFSHPVDFNLPDGVDATVDKNTLLILKSIDAERLGQTCAEIRAYRLPEPYKGKGICYVGEKILRKVGKKK